MPLSQTFPDEKPHAKFVPYDQATSKAERKVPEASVSATTQVTNSKHWKTRLFWLPFSGHDKFLTEPYLACKMLHFSI